MSFPDNPAERAALVTALREFADTVESDPTIPTPNFFTFYSFLHAGDGTEAERFGTVHDFAEAHGATVTVKDGNGREAEAHIGLFRLVVHAFADERRNTGGTVTRASDPALNSGRPALATA